VAHEIERLNQDCAVTGIMIHLPMPPWIGDHAMQYRIDRPVHKTSCRLARCGLNEREPRG
jgi:hypothetical protein